VAELTPYGMVPVSFISVKYGLPYPVEVTSKGSATSDKGTTGYGKGFSLDFKLPKA
jgi:hypothetical protein